MVSGGLSPQAQMQVANDARSFIRSQMQELDPRTLAGHFSNNQDPFILTLLTQLPNLTIEMQKVLLKSKNKHVLALLAKNSSISERTQLVLAENKSVMVRYFLSNNLNLSQEVQNRLARDANRDVRCEFRRNYIQSDSSIEMG